MTKMWSEIAESSDFKTLPDEDKEVVRESYFERVVAPEVAPEHLAATREQFDSATRARNRPLPASTADEPPQRRSQPSGRGFSRYKPEPQPQPGSLNLKPGETVLDRISGDGGAAYPDTPTEFVAGATLRPGTEDAVRSKLLAQGRMAGGPRGEMREAPPESLVGSGLRRLDRKPLDNSGGGAILETVGDAARGLAKVGPGLVTAGYGVTQAIGDVVGADSLSESGRRGSAAGRLALSQFDNPNGDKLVTGAFQSLGTMALGGAAGGAAGATGLLVGQTGGNKYSELRAGGIPVADALEGATAHMLAEYLGERIGMKSLGRLVSGLSKKTGLPPTQVLKEVLKQQGEEQVTLAIQSAYDKLGSGSLRNDMTWDQYLDDVVDTASQTAIMTAAAGGGGAVMRAAGGKKQEPQFNYYELAKSKGFLVDPPLKTDKPSVQRTKTDTVLDDVASWSGLNPDDVAAAKQAAARLPLAKVPGFYAKFVGALQKRGLAPADLDPDIISALQAGSIDDPELAKSESEPTKSASTTAVPASASGETGSVADEDLSGLAEPADLTTGDGQPYGTRAGAAARATREGGGDVVPVEGGWVVRPPEPEAKPVFEIKEREDGTGFDAVNAEGKRVGYLNDNLKRGQAEQIDESANVEMVKVDKAMEGQGIGRALYKAFEEKHGGRIMPSGKTEPGAWRQWKKHYPQKVDAFVAQEAARIRDGADPALVVRNITDQEIRARVAEAAQTKKPENVAHGSAQPHLQRSAELASPPADGGSDRPAASGRTVGSLADGGARGVGAVPNAPAQRVRAAAPVEHGGAKPATVGRVIARAGTTPNTAQPIELRDNQDGTSTPWHEGYEMLDHESGDPIKVPAGATPREALDAIKQAGALGRRMKVFADKDESQDKPAATDNAPTNSLAKTANWVIKEKGTGRIVMETFDRKKVDALNTAKYEATPILENLQSLNAPKAAPAKASKASKTAKARMAFNPETDSVLQALAKMGGVRRDIMAKEFGLKPEELKHTVAAGNLKGFPFRANGGMGLDGAITALQEAGYFAGVSEADLRNAFEAAIYADLGGGRTLTPAGQMAAAEAAYNDRAAQEFDAEAAAEREAIMDEAGISEADMAALSDDDIDLDTGSNTSTEAFMRSMGFTEQEIRDELEKQTADAQAGAAEDRASAGQEAGRPDGAGSAEARLDAAGAEEGLTFPTDEGLRAQAKRATDAAAAERADQKGMFDGSGVKGGVQNPDNDIGLLPPEAVAKMKDGPAAVEWLVANAKDPAHRDMAQRLRPFIDPTVSTRLVKVGDQVPAIVSARLSDSAVAVAQMRSDGNYVLWLHTGKSLNEAIVLHELIHAATMRALNTSKNQVLLAEMEKTLKAVRSSFAAIENTDAVAMDQREQSAFFNRVLTDPDELLAYAFSSPTMRRWMQNMNADGKFIPVEKTEEALRTRAERAEGPEPGPLTMWQKFVDLVRQLLRIGKRHEPALQQMLADREARIAGVIKAGMDTKLYDRLDDYLERAMKAQAADAGPTAGAVASGSGKATKVALREFLGKSKVRRVVYHATTADFDVFDTSKGDLGAHFGTIDQANKIAARRLGGVPGVRIMPVWLHLENPLRLKDVGTFHADGIAVQLERKGLLPRGEGKRIEKEIDADWRKRKEYDPVVRDAIKAAGHDGVVYSNTAEGEGPGDSYIVFEPTQIKSATGNNGTFDRRDPNIRMDLPEATDSKKAFNDWFKVSKVVDSKGRPLVVYHGTDSDITKFDPKKIGNNFRADERGFFFTSNPSEASAYAENDTVGLNKRTGANVMPAHLSMQKPLVIDAAFLKAEGMGGLLGPGGREDTISFWDTYQAQILEWADERKADGVIVEDSAFTEANGEPRRLFVAFKPTQIKSAIGNQGTFDGRNPDIRMDVASAPDTTAFKAWFDKSVVVDEAGQPLVAYHGTNAVFDQFDPRKIKSFNEGVGFYFTANPAIADAYGKRTPVYLSLQKPLAYDAAPFRPPVMQKILRLAAELEAARNEAEIADGFLSNFDDIRTSGIDRVVRAAATQLAREESANDQIGGLFNAGLSFDALTQAVRDVTGHDGFTAKGFSNEGTNENAIFVAWFPEQIKHAEQNRGAFDPTNPDIRADFSGQQIPTGEAIDTGPVDPANQAALTKIQGEFRRKVPAFQALTLTALPDAPRPAAGDTPLRQERYAAAQIAKHVFGNEVVFFSSNLDQFANGLMVSYAPNTVFVNESTTRPVMAVVGHELTHSMRQENPALYNKLGDRLRSLLKEPGEYHEQMAAKYRARGIPALSFDKMREELVADIVGDNFTDPAFWRAMAQGQPNLFQRVLKAVREFLDGVLAKLKNERPYATSRYLTDVQAARDAVAATMKEFAQRQQAAQQTRDEEGRFVAETTTPALSEGSEPFYSELARQVELAQMKQAPAAGWLEWLKGLGSKGVKPDEIAWTGIEDWLSMQDGKVSREAVLEFLNGNGVKVTETVLKDDDRRTAGSAEAEGFGQVEFADNPRENTKYSQYTLPGGANYQELLLTLPVTPEPFSEPRPEPFKDLPQKYEVIRDRSRPEGQQFGITTADEISARPLFGRSASPEEAKADALASLNAARDSRWKQKKIEHDGKKPGYKSSHWDQRNILAHIRFNERTDAEGRRVLFVEELQGDWPQAMRKERDKIGKAVDDDFQGIVDRMKAAGVLEVECD